MQRTGTELRILLSSLGPLKHSSLGHMSYDKCLYYIGNLQLLKR